MLLMFANKLSEGKIPGGDTVHRFVSGFAVGGLAGVGLSSLHSRIITENWRVITTGTTNSWNKD
jgi:hypothetical protein